MEKMNQTQPDFEMGAEGTHATGKLKIFFGYAAGVGKTYVLLYWASAKGCLPSDSGPYPH